MKTLSKEERFTQEIGKYVESYLALKKKALPDLTLWGPKDMDIVSEYMSRIGRRGGLKRVSKGIGKLTPAQRTEMSKKAAAARWGSK